MAGTSWHLLARTRETPQSRRVEEPDPLDAIAEIAAAMHCGSDPPIDVDAKEEPSRMDALSETLRVVRLVGAIFIEAKFTAPWCYNSPPADTAAPFLEPGAERVVIFHLITEGECYVEMGGNEPPVHLTAGDAVVFPQGHAHRMTSQPGLPPAKGKRLDEVLSRRPRVLAYGGGGARTRLVCGYLACDARLAKMLLAGLPALLKVSVRGSNAGIWLEASVRYALAKRAARARAAQAFSRSSPRCSSSRCCAST
jgi:hypothetical protein